MESLSRPRHSRNHSTSSILSKKLSAANGFSAKNAYDGVFAGPARFGAPTVSSGVEDYGEIFGGGSAAPSRPPPSIPFLDLPSIDETNASIDSRSSRLDYSKVFGGFRDEDLASSYDEMFARQKRDGNFSEEARSPAKKVSPSERSDHLNRSEEHQELSHEASNESLDGVKQFNMSYHKITQRSDKGSNGTTHIAQIHAVPGFTCFIDGNNLLQKAKCDESVPALKTDIHLNTNSNEGTIEGKHYRKVMPNDSNLTKEQKSEGVIKTHPSKVSPPSSLPPKFINSKSIPKRSVASNSEGPKNGGSRGGFVDCSPTLSDEELDVNSAAAVSAAALRKAINRAQESIRMAKESMERSKVGLRSHKKPLSKGGFEGKGRKENRVAGEAKKTKEKKVDAVLHVFSGTEGQNVMQSGKVATDFHEGTMNKEESAEVCEVAKQTSEVENLDKHRTATLASEQAESKNNHMHSIDTDDCENKDIQTRKVILDRQEGNIKKAVEQKIDWEDIEKKVKVNLSQDWEEHGNRLKSTQAVHEKEAQESLETEEKQRASCELEIPEKILQESKEPTENEKSFECRVRQDESQGNQEVVLEEVEHEMILKDDGEKGENGDRLKISILDEIEKKLKEVCGWLQWESKPKESCEIGSSKERQNDCHKGEQKEKILDEVNELEVDIDEKRQDGTRAEREIEENVEEDYTWQGNERTNVEPYGYEETESLQRETGKTVYDERIQVNSEVVKDEKDHDAGYTWQGNERTNVEPYGYEETESLQRETGKTVYDERIQMTSEVVKDEKDHDAGYTWQGNERTNVEPYGYEETESLQRESGKTVYAERIQMTSEFVKDEKDHDAGDSLNGTQEACRCEENIDMVGLSQEVNACEEIVKIMEVTEFFSEFEEDEKVREPVKVINDLESKETCKAANDVESAVENKMEDASEAFLFDDSSADFDLNYTSFVEGQIEQNEKDIDLPSNLENCMSNDESNDESEENRCEFKEAEIAFDKEEEGDHDEIQRIDTEASQLSYMFKGEEKTIEIDEENSEKNKKNVNESFVVEEEETKATLQREVKEAEVAFDQEQDKDNVERAHKERQRVEIEKTVDAFEPSRVFFKGKKAEEIEEEIKISQNMEKNEDNPYINFAVDGKEPKETAHREAKVEKKHLQKIDEVHTREKEREKQKIVVERAIREARERAFAEARERAERAAVERATAEARQRVMAEAREKLQKASAGAKLSLEKASTEAKLRAERAAVERATAEARERALEKALSHKATSERFSGASRDNGIRQSFSVNDTQRAETSNNESAQRRKAKFEKNQRIMERAAKALAEKNKRDVLAQKEQAERNRLAEALDAEVKRWSSGKEGNLRALLSTLQYVLGTDSGWQPVSLTDIVTTNAVKKAYRKATLYVHPDKLQQRGANIRQKYICEKVFDLLKAAYNKFNSEER